MLNENLLLFPPDKKLITQPEIIKPDLDAWMDERERVLTKCLAEPSFRTAFIAECKEDPIYWMQHTAWAFDPRKGNEAEQPFIPWDFQERIVRELTELLFKCLKDPSFVGENIVIDKARDMGGSFIVLYTFMWFFMFHESSFIIGSRKEEEVDKIGDMDTPFEKLRYNLRRQPEFLLPPGYDLDSKKYNKERLLTLKPSGHGGPQIVGESANENFGRGGRALAALCDEFQKWQFDDQAWRSLSGTCKVRIALGTPDGPFNKFARLVHGKDNEKIKHIRLHWYYHPDRRKNLQERNGKMWSEWLQAMTEKESIETMAREYLLDYNLSQKGIIFEDTFNEDVHCDPNLEIDYNSPILRICDPGLTFAWLYAQVTDDGQMFFHKELVIDQAILENVMDNMINISNTLFEDCEFETAIGDPQGQSRLVAGQQDADYTLMQRLWGIAVNSRWLANIQSKQREKMRITTLNNKLGERIYNNEPAIKINPIGCPLLVEAFKGGYRREVDKSGQVLDTVDRRHPWADIMDCAGMAAVYKFLIQTGKVSSLSFVKKEKKWTSGNRRSS